MHTGDFRADKSVCKNPIVRSLRGRLDTLYLDTTYCGPRHAFPDQAEVGARVRIWQFVIFIDSPYRQEGFVR